MSETALAWIDRDKESPVCNSDFSVNETFKFPTDPAPDPEQDPEENPEENPEVRHHPLERK